MAKGYVYDGKTLVDGKTWPKGTYYNFYGIGAYDSSPLSGGRALAIKNGWDTPEKAIHGAARWIATNYLNNAFSQNTLYKMRWNYVEYARYARWVTSMRLIVIGRLNWIAYECNLCLCQRGPGQDGVDISGAKLSLVARHSNDVLGYTDILSNGFA